MRRWTMTAGICITVGLLGCAPTHFAKPGGSVADFDQDKARCDYETTGMTQQTDYGYQTVFGQELNRALRQRELMKKCLIARGWQEERR